jgi:pyruvate kinase
MFIALSGIKEQLEELNGLLLSKEKQYQSLLKKVHSSQHASARNLLHYLIFRSQDFKELQQALHKQGYSSLTNAEGYIRSQILAVLKHFGVYDQEPCTFEASKMLLEGRANELYGKSSESIPSIMVTLKTSHATDVLAVKKLLRAGMNIARINCAHDNEEIWFQMILNVRKATEVTGMPCKIYMDLAGPKIRTKIKRVQKERVLIEEGDSFYLTENEDFKSKLPVVICTEPGIINQLKEGERVFFDDGLFEARIVSVQPGVAQLEMLRVSAKKPYLKTEKGINFPDTRFSLAALTQFDQTSLTFIQEHADLVGYSFVHNIDDLSALQTNMQSKKIPVILKIETPDGFNNLPDLLFKAMEDECYGVMIARGDLAVEVGFEKMSQVQEEISLLCEAAHAPIIWATQVLETMNKSGLPTRSEITDASIGITAECVMLNKGAHTVRAIKALKTILESSSTFHYKKKYLLRPLKKAQEFFETKNFG